jgi:Glyoxalase/Bleomycin resistance protein/Dioxygenase superfamily
MGFAGYTVYRAILESKCGVPPLLPLLCAASYRPACVLLLSCAVPQSMLASLSAPSAAWEVFMAVRVEHANLTVRDIEGMIRFLQTAFPEFRMRGEGKSRDGFRWVHIGTDETYIALNPANAKPEKSWTPYRGLPGVNHLAYEVDDVEALCRRMKSADSESLRRPTHIRTASAGTSTIPKATIGNSCSTSPRIPRSATIISCRISSTCHFSTPSHSAS